MSLASRHVIVTESNQNDPLHGNARKYRRKLSISQLSKRWLSSHSKSECTSQLFKLIPFFFLFYQSGARWKRIVTVSWERTNHFNDNSWWLSQLNGWLKSLICGRLEENGLQLFEQSGRWLLVGPITALSFSVIYWSLEFGGGGGGGHHSTVMFGPQPGQPTNKSWSHLLSLFWPEIGRIFNWDLSQINVVNVQSRSEFNAMNSTKNPIHWQKLLKIEQESATEEDFVKIDWILAENLPWNHQHWTKNQPKIESKICQKLKINSKSAKNLP